MGFRAGAKLAAVALAVFPRIVTSARVMIEMWQPICASSAATCGWPAGNSMNVSAYLMVERINQANMLGDHTLQLDVKDTQCSAAQGTAKADSLVATAKASWPFAVIGCGCSGCTMAAAPILSTHRIPQVSQAAASAALSDRTKYPHFFRTYPSDGPVITIWLTIFKTWEVTRFAMVYDKQWGESSVSYFANALKKFNAANSGGPAGVTMTDVFSGSTQGMMTNATAVQAQAVITNLAVHRKKGVIGGIMMMGYASALRHLACGLFTRTSGGHADLDGLAFSHFGSYSASWWHDNLSELNGCTKANMDKLTNTWIFATPRMWGTGSAKLGCDPSYTVDQFKTTYTSRRTALNFQQRSTEIGATADAICTIATVFKQMLDARHKISDLLGVQLNSSTFDAVNAKIQNVQFAGVSGNISFPTGSKASANGGGDRIAIFEVFQKISIPPSSGYKMLGTFDMSVANAKIQFAEGASLQKPPSATVSPVTSVTGTIVTGSLWLSMSEADANTITGSGADARKVKDAFADSLAQSMGENPPDIWISKDMIEIIAITKGSRRRLEQTLRQLSGGNASGVNSSVKVKVDYSIRVPDGMTITAVAAKVVAMSHSLFMATASSKLLAAGIRSALCPTGPGHCTLQAIKITGMDVPLAPTVKSASTAPNGSDSDGLGAGAIAGIVVGGAVVLTIIIIVVIFMCTRKKTKPLNQIVPCESDIPDAATPTGPSPETVG